MSQLHLTVAAVVERLGRYLVVEELADGRQVINQPAGHVEPGEALLDAVIREAREETARAFTPLAISGVYLWQQPASGERFLRVVFCGHCGDPAPEQPLDEGILRALWLTRDELAERQSQLRSPMVLRAIDDYLDGQRFPVGMFQQLEPDVLARHAQVV